MTFSSLARVLAPMTIGNVELKNRIFVPAHTTNYAVGNTISQRNIDYLTRKARGGAGLIFTEGIRVHPSSLRRFGLGGYSPEAMQGFERLAESVHEAGAKLFAQVLHTGRHDGSEWTGMWAPSAQPWSSGREIPHSLRTSEIHLLTRAYGTVTKSLVDSGFDGAEIHLGHGHLLQQFLSPITNTRTDAYGGSYGNRLRFPREVLEGIFSVTDAPIGIRISADEMMAGGLAVDDMLQVCHDLVAEFPIAFLHVSHSAYVGEYSLSTQMADMSFSTAPFMEYPRRFKHEFAGTPVLAVCRVDDLKTAEEVLSSDSADMVGMARAHIADPDLVLKMTTGRADQIRSCISCNQACVGRLEKTLPIRCVVNPETGMESEWSRIPKPSAHSTVLVVGGGPAGMEAAIAAHDRGHRVVLAESSPTLGGQVRLVERLSARERFGLLTRELERDVRSRNIEIHLDTTVTATDIVSGDYDSVIVSTGSYPPPADDGRIDAWKAINDPDALEPHVVIVDDDGGWAAPSLALTLAQKGRTVDIVTTMDSAFPAITVYSRLSLYPSLEKAGVALHVLSNVSDDNSAIDKTLGTRIALPANTSVVSVRPQVAADGLARELETLSFSRPVHVVGDAYAPRSAMEATFEGRGAGYLVGVAIGNEWNGPALRTPYIENGGGELITDLITHDLAKAGS
ncbi:FAD-dependent oxidoreductase [Microbacterium sp. MPKO10]|uniref:oxidoreductase n=1 Tax=Microbacterium sp. MPKO10 TaxID=2989818 RepID=UPI002235F3C0|nr:FAD-dependent oxidoreductase [Microbacterium sp. MPKO10]MCW4459859.1 FAD-dependent oxidoreductase [Microbacterium sp. MPKO10]